MLSKFHLKICIVDDDVMCLNLYRQFLLQLGYTNIEIFDNGADCLDNLEELHPDVVFLDYYMEEMNGIDVLKKIKKFDPSIIVLFISGQENIEVAINAMKQGAVDYIVKSSLTPDRMKEIMERLEEFALLKPAAGKKSFFRKMFS